MTVSRRLRGAYVVAVVMTATLLPALPAHAAAKCAGVRATITGNDRDNKLKGTSGNDVIVAGGGNDRVDGGGGDDLVCAGGGKDKVTGGGGIDYLLGQGGNDSINGSGHSDFLFGGPGNDGLEGGPGPNSDAVAYSLSKTAVNVDLATGKATGEGTDSLSGFEAAIGSARDDTLNGGAGNDFLQGLDGNDTIFGGGGVDVLAGDAGNDLMDGGEDTDYATYLSATAGVQVDLAAGTSSGASGNDSFDSIEGIYGSEFDDALTGGPTDDLFIGFAGDDTISGLAGIDLLEGGAGDDTLNGGDNSDLITHLTSTSPVSVDLGQGTATGEGTDTLTSIEAADGTPGNDVLKGNAQTNFFFTSPGNDSYHGAEGTDLVLFSFSSVPATANLGTGTATADGSYTLTNIEGLVGSPFDDTLTGDAQGNILFGFAGNDLLAGGDGNDWMIGGDGDDTMDGGAGDNDIVEFSFAPSPVVADLTAGTASGEGSDTLTAVEALSGSPGNDVLSGDAGANFLYGELGNDTLSGREGNDGLDGGEGTNTIDGGVGTDQCFAGTATNCETATKPPAHPLFASANEMAEFFSRHR